MPRPRNFDENVALDRAMTLFWRHGYDGTSLNDLTVSMGINRPSLYATFGNKEALFRRALARYGSGPTARVAAAFALPTARATVEELLSFYAEAPALPNRPLGCLLLNGALGASAEAESVRVELSKVRTSLVTRLRKRLEVAQRTGELAGDASPAELAQYFWAVLQGMAVQATDGATRAELRKVARLAMAAWPERASSSRRP